MTHEHDCLCGRCCVQAIAVIMLAYGALFGLLVLSCSQAHAADIRFLPTAVHVKAGKSAWMGVVFGEGALPHLGFDFTFRFDPRVIVLSLVKTGAMTRECLSLQNVLPNELALGKLRVAFACPKGLVTGSFALQVTARADAVGVTQVEPTACHLDEGQEPCTMSSGLVFIDPMTPAKLNQAEPPLVTGRKQVRIPLPAFLNWSKRRKP